MRVSILATGLALAFGLRAPALASTAILHAAKDTTLYETPDGSLSNGAGQHVFTGRTAIGRIRRGLIAFDVAGALPAGAVVEVATLSLHMSMTIAPAQSVALHAVAASWGEAGSLAAGEEGGGAPSQPGDATWLHRFYPSVPWISPGGDFSAAASASTVVGVAGTYTWSSPAMVADVQLWLDDPGSDAGWILIGNESVAKTTKRFDSRSNAASSDRPVLTIQYSFPASAAGAVPDGRAPPGTPMTLARDGSGLALAWSHSCAPGDDDYCIYEGALGAFNDTRPLLCSTSGATTATVSPSPGDRFYLVVPRTATVEGSYGKNGEGAERPPSAEACLPQETSPCL